MIAMIWLRRAQLAPRFFGRTLFGALRAPFVPAKYEVRAGYFHRIDNEHFNDTANEDGWQREVYERARDLMCAHDLRTVLDVGCGSGYKLVNILGEFETTGIDVDPAYSFLLEKYSARRWLKAFTAPADAAQADLVICSDVI
jgi:SAM-dependent methyltransferase